MLSRRTNARSPKIECEVGEITDLMSVVNNYEMHYSQHTVSASQDHARGKLRSKACDGRRALARSCMSCATDARRQDRHFWRAHLALKPSRRGAAPAAPEEAARDVPEAQRSTARVASAKRRNLAPRMRRTASAAKQAKA